VSPEPTREQVETALRYGNVSGAPAPAPDRRSLDPGLIEPPEFRRSHFQTRLNAVATDLWRDATRRAYRRALLVGAVVVCVVAAISFWAGRG
jgi:hypothetical protein